MQCGQVVSALRIESAVIRVRRQISRSVSEERRAENHIPLLLDGLLRPLLVITACRPAEIIAEGLALELRFLGVRTDSKGKSQLTLINRQRRSVSICRITA